MTTQKPNREAKICQECGAENWAYVDVCWLCKAEIGGAETVITAELVKPRVSASADTFFAIAAAMLAIVIVLVGIGLFFEEPGAAIGYLILVTPPFVVTLIRTTLKQQREGYVGWGERLATFVISTLALGAILGLLAVAAFVAFFIYCLVALSNGGF